mmetsp:Transcript_52724/g.85449  ORF Transcript_52724/g.85449 Transcript_52724/m.85449 type:complete len:159 (-) Transcript_52724:113-589(-)|eukprot:CAMPEP_0115084872 /NCGR_PEP_ID=MMETSP0227-20121206/21568_1 /TAXON_ID=89957 /ORGANISM="Polarella glacialis, Strain CCMP 1383" /LENGTH=158 /DNA_ID=CAMNT_0002473861 /DNA_START=64 /DNA_END=540 /DNA_ORIENTATION=+
MAGIVEKRLAQIGLTIPASAAPAANYLPWIRNGRLVFVSGQIPKLPDNSLMKGKLGLDVDLEHGKAAARLCGLHLVGQMKAAAGGNLDKVRRIVKVEAFVNATETFTEHPQVVNGCSDVLVEIFGTEVGAHSRFAVGCSSLPLGVSVEIGAVVEIEEE